MTKEQAEQILISVINEMKLTRKEYELLIKALEILKKQDDI